MEILKQYSGSKQIVLSTHSEFVVDNLAPEQVRLVERDQSIGTQARALSAAMSERDFQALKEYLREFGGLGEYWRHSGFGT